jgi:hypothetical protein
MCMRRRVPPTHSHLHTSDGKKYPALVSGETLHRGARPPLRTEIKRVSRVTVSGASGVVDRYPRAPGFTPGYQIPILPRPSAGLRFGTRNAPYLQIRIPMKLGSQYGFIEGTSKFNCTKLKHQYCFPGRDGISDQLESAKHCVGQ